MMKVKAKIKKCYLEITAPLFLDLGIHQVQNFDAILSHKEMTPKESCSPNKLCICSIGIG